MLLLSSHAQAAASTSLLKDLLVAAGKGRLHEVQSLLDGGRCKVNDEDEVCTSIGTVTSVLRILWWLLYACRLCVPKCYAYGYTAVHMHVAIGLCEFHS